MIAAFFFDCMVGVNNNLYNEGAERGIVYCNELLTQVVKPGLLKVCFEIVAKTRLSIGGGPLSTWNER